MKTFFNRIFLILFSLWFVSSCATNPTNGERIFVLTSSEQEERLGSESYQEIVKKGNLSKNRNLAKRIEIIAQRLINVSGNDSFQWEIKTFEDKTPNAFCLPGGKIGVYTGILPFALNDAGLAAVIGHEIGHALARHGGQRLAQQFGTEVAIAALTATALSKTSKPKKELALSALGLGATIGILLPFSRSHETEADEIGLRLMALAGYDPSEAINFWSRFSKIDNNDLAFLSTHPSSLDRMANLKEMLPTVMELYHKSPQQFGKGLEF